MNQHDESSSTDVVDTPGEADEEDGRYMVNNLLFKVLKGRRKKGCLCHERREHFNKFCMLKFCLELNPDEKYLRTDQGSVIFYFKTLFGEHLLEEIFRDQPFYI